MSCRRPARPGRHDTVAYNGRAPPAAAITSPANRRWLNSSLKPPSPRKESGRIVVPIQPCRRNRGSRARRDSGCFALIPLAKRVSIGPCSGLSWRTSGVRKANILRNDGPRFRLLFSPLSPLILFCLKGIEAVWPKSEIGFVCAVFYRGRGFQHDCIFVAAGRDTVCELASCGVAEIFGMPGSGA